MRRILLVPLFLLALACDGGGGTQVASGGIGGTGISSGSVTGFGSFFVTGTEWRVGAGGTVEIDGELMSEDDLELGMFLRVEGSRSPDGSAGLARRVRYDEAVRGVVSGEPLAVGPERLRFDVLGHVVEADPGQTVFAGDVTFATLAMNDVVEVSGPVAQNGRIRATRIVGLGDFAPGLTQVELKGEVESLDASGFSIGSVGIALDDCDGLDTQIDPALEPLEDGDLVEVEGFQTGADPDAVDACAIRSFTPLAQELGEDSEDVEVQGVIEDFAGLGDFTVNGIPVDASAAELEPDDPDLFDDGVLVEVEGDVVGGVLEADQLELDEGEARVAAEVTAAGLANVDARRIVLLDDGTSRVEIVVPAGARIEGDDEDGSLDLSELAPGDFLEVRGIDLGDGRLRATEIEVEDDGQDGVQLVGRVDDVDTTADGGKGFTLLGVFVELVQGSTQLPGGATVDEFLSGLSGGELLKAKDGGVDLATFGVAAQVELEGDVD